MIYKTLKLKIEQYKPHYECCLQEDFEDTKDVIRICKSKKDRQHNVSICMVTLNRSGVVMLRVLVSIVVNRGLDPWCLVKSETIQLTFTASPINTQH